MHFATRLVVRATAALIAALVFSAATVETTDLPWLPPAADVARDFVEAWSAGDFDAMAAMFDEDASGLPTSAALQADFENTLRDGAITQHSVTLTGVVAEPRLDAPPQPDDELSIESPFRIAYESEAVARPIELSGSFTLTYDPLEDAWEVPWERSLLWPGVEGAEGFAVSFR